MRMTRLFGVCLFVASTFATACGGGGGSKPGADASVNQDGSVVLTDAPPQSNNALGQLCPLMAGGGGAACPTGNNCVGLMGLGSTTTGYCTPDCMNTAAICTTGYTGPAGGMPQCALVTAMGQPPNGCAIVCTATAQCPTGLTCTPVPNQPVMICVPPA